jgi:hypothetical protein
MNTVGRRIFISGFVAALCSTEADADDLYDQYTHSVSKKPFVSFLARSTPGSGLPGHIFVCVGMELDNGTLFYQSIFGFYPKDDNTLNEIKALIVPVNGSLDYKLPDLSWTVEFRRSINGAQMSAALGVAKEWKGADPKYNLFANNGKNCNAFARAVALAVGLKAPDSPGLTLPLTYIRTLKAMN